MASRFKINCRKSGTDRFTLIEVIAVLVLSGILLTVILSTTSAVAGYELADKLKAQLRYAKIQAVNTDSVWGIQFEGSSYHLLNGGNTASKVMLLGEDANDLDICQFKNAYHG